MAIGPILPGRIPNGLSVRRANQSLQIQGSELQRLRDQITTGQQFQLPGEDPAAALKTIILQSELERSEQFRTNVEASRSLLATTEQTLGEIGNVFSEAQSLLLQGVGANSTSEEKQLLADEVDTLIQNIANLSNTKFRDRYLFAGGNANSAPYELVDGGYLFTGTAYENQATVNDGQLLTNNASPVDVLSPFAEVSGGNLDPALSLDTELSELNGGRGVRLGVIEVSVDTGGGAVTEQIDLSGAQTVGDLKTLLETPFGGDLIVEVDPTTNHGIRLRENTGLGTVAVADQALSYVASDLGIRSTAVTAINGEDLDPQLSHRTLLADLNGGTGIGAVVGTGLQITHGNQTVVVDLSAATTVEDVLNAIRASGLHVDAEINEAATGLTIRGRISGSELSIGENNGANATNLGIRSLTGSTKLEDLNNGIGVPLDGAERFTITRRDGTDVDVDLTGVETIQDVVDAVNAIDPGNLVASLNAVGNGISITDNSGVGPLSVVENELTQRLGLGGTEPGADNTVPLVGEDPNPQRSEGIVDLLIRLRDALEAEDDAALAAVDEQLDQELRRFNTERGDVGRRLQALDQASNAIENEILLINESLSNVFDTDLTEAITQLSNVQTYFEATQRIAVQTIQLNLFQFL